MLSWHLPKGRYFSVCIFKTPWIFSMTDQCIPFSHLDERKDRHLQNLVFFTQKGHKLWLGCLTAPLVFVSRADVCPLEKSIFSLALRMQGWNLTKAEKGLFRRRKWFGWALPFLSHVILDILLICPLYLQTHQLLEPSGRRTCSEMSLKHPEDKTQPHLQTHLIKHVAKPTQAHGKSTCW